MSASPRVASSIAARLHRQSAAMRWGVPLDQFQAVLEGSVARAFADRAATPDELDRYFASLHLEDLVLASACAAGHEAAWDHFVREHRPALYRAADAIDPTGGARELADALYADLFGMRERAGVRQSLFRYFHGRSSLATWLRAVLSQRHIDRLRAGRKLDPLPDDDAPAAGAGLATQDDSLEPERPRFIASMRRALASAVAALAPRDRLRLRCYYAQDLTLAAIGRMLGEHEGTVSRHLTRTRRAIREAVEASLRRDHGFDEPEIAQCFASVVGDAGSLDLVEMIGGAPDGKIPEPDRSR